jgi:hypothetical protein
MVFEAVLAAPLVSLSLLKTDGEGFGTQQFNTSMTMLFGVIIRPILMTIGLVLGLIAFNAIMQITNLLFAPTVQNLNPSSDVSYVSLGVYMIFYATLAYTLANSAFKAIDMLPNFVMGWIGQRMESRVDDASMVQQQAQGYMQTMAYSARSGMGGTGSNLERMQAHDSALQKAGFVDSSGKADWNSFDKASQGKGTPDQTTAANNVKLQDPFITSDPRFTDPNYSAGSSTLGTARVGGGAKPAPPPQTNQGIGAKSGGGKPADGGHQ